MRATRKRVGEYVFDLNRVWGDFGFRPNTAPGFRQAVTTLTPSIHLMTPCEAVQITNFCMIFT